MKKLAIAFAGLAAIGFSGAAFAEEATTTTTGPAAMTDAEMDGVTAGASLNVPGLGNDPAGNGNVILGGPNPAGAPPAAAANNAVKGFDKSPAVSPGVQ